jgi:hypothetical protein
MQSRFGNDQGTRYCVKIAETLMMHLTNSRLAWFNGKFMPENQVLISFRDRSWKYSDGAFDMTRTFNGRASRLKSISTASIAPCVISVSIPA